MKGIPVSDTTRKIKTREELAELSEEWRREGLIVGFTSGVFDLLHAGHVEYLEKAMQECDILIIGVNSDESVRRYKGPERPINPQEQRARVVAALESVDYVFIFSERRNHANIEALRPDLYIKAGDYTADQLTSRELVEAYGGKILLIPVETPTSTTKILEKIRSGGSQNWNQIVEFDRAVYFPAPKPEPRPAVFLDRDGTINEDVEYLSDPEQLQLLPNALEGLKKLQDMGYRLVIVTTQAGIGLGYFRVEDFYRVNRRMFQLLSPAGVVIDKIYFCPHSLAENCPCRKPRTKLLEQAQKDLNIDMAHSYIIGDKTSDIQTGINAGIRTILVQTGKAGKDGEYDVQPDYIARDLLDAANWILEQERKEDR